MSLNKILKGVFSLSMIDLARTNEAGVMLPPFANVTRNGCSENAVRLLLVTVIGSKLAPAGTFTVNEEAVAAVTVAFTWPKKTVLAEGVVLKFTPEMVTVVPIGPDDGLKEVIAGGGNQVNPATEADPNEVEAATDPDAPELTMALTSSVEIISKDCAAVPPMVTPVTSAREVPLIVMMVPCVPFVGENEVITGKATNPASEPVPLGDVTLTDPDDDDGAVAVILVDETTLKDEAGTPPNNTALALLKSNPLMVMVVPAFADVGLKDVIVGGGRNVNPAFVPEPNVVATRTLPDAPAPTIALMLVEDKTLKLFAGTLPNVTETTSSKSSPVISISVFGAAVVGLNEETITGGGNIAYFSAVSAMLPFDTTSNRVSVL
jgi:hypothetical protein